MPATIRYRELKRRYDLDGPAKTVRHLREAIGERKLVPSDFSIRDLAEALVPDGREWVASLNPRKAGGHYPILQEAGEGVDITAFSNITGQIIYSRVLEAYNREEFVASRLVPSQPTPFNGEKIGGVQGLSDTTQDIQPGMPYPSFGYGEDYIETPQTTKRGFIVPVTKEAVFFDRTGQVLGRAGEVGEVLGLAKEKRLIDAVIGATNTHKWKGSSYNTYQGTTPWVNTITGNDIVGWENIDAIEQLFANMLDPNTGEPVLVSGKTILATPARRLTLARVLGASEVRVTPSGAATQTISSNPVSGYMAETSRLLYRRLIASGVSASNAKAYAFIGDFSKAFAYMENWPITVVSAPSNSEAEFTQDIVARWKASERGEVAVLNPRYIVKSTG